MPRDPIRQGMRAAAGIEGPGYGLDPEVDPRASVLETPEKGDRRRKRVAQEVFEGVQRKSKHGMTPAAIPDFAQLSAGLAQLEVLLPGFQPNVEAMPARAWVSLAMDMPTVAARLAAFKAAYPAMDLSRALMRFPRGMLREPQDILRDATQVRQLLRGAKDADKIVQEVPELMEPRTCASVLVSLRMWWRNTDPIVALERDPDIVRRAQEMDQPFAPVWQDADGNWVGQNGPDQD